MDESTFWSIVARSRPTDSSDREEHLSRLRVELMRLSPEDVLQFKRRLDGYVDAAYRWDLWGAAYLLNGGCSDDGFEYFRGWLIALGESAYARVLSNPDSLAQVAPPGNSDEWEFESFLYVPYEVYEELTGGEMPPFPRGAIERPAGTEWDFEDTNEMKRHYPQLWERVKHQYR